MTMVLPKYEPNFASLSTEQAAYLAQHMAVPVEPSLSGLRLYQVANERKMDQADVVMTLATDATTTGIEVVEALVGKPIDRGRNKQQPRVRGERRSVTVRRSDPRKIVYVSPTNPKKAGSASYDRFALYKEGMSIDEFVAAGGTMGDVKWDAERGFIKLEGDA